MRIVPVCLCITHTEFSAVPRKSTRALHGWLTWSLLALISTGQSAAFAGDATSRRKNSDLIDLVGVPVLPMPGEVAHSKAPPPSKPAATPRPAPQASVVPAAELPVRAKVPPVKSAAALPAQAETRPAAPVDTSPPVALKLRIPAQSAAVPADFIASIAPVAAPRPVVQAEPPVAAVAVDPAPPTARVAAMQPHRPAAIPALPAPDTDETAMPVPSFDEARAPRRIVRELETPRVARSEPRPLPTARSDASATPATGGPSVKIDYVVRAQPLDQLLRDIGQMAGFSVVAGGGVRGVVRERRLEGAADKLIDQLAREFGLFWFHDGLTVYVDPLDEQKTKFFKVRGATPAQLSRALEDAGLGKYRSRIQLTGKDGMVRVAGSDAFTRSVEAALTTTDVENTTVHVIRFGQRGQ